MANPKRLAFTLSVGTLLLPLRHCLLQVLWIIPFQAIQYIHL